ncbi:MAG: hypothetical protein U0165_18085 [Polyangiaceae bacterium]
MTRKRSALAVLLGAMLGVLCVAQVPQQPAKPAPVSSTSASASARDAGVSTAPSSGPAVSSSASAGSVKSSCIEQIPSGATKPGIFESIPKRIKAGYSIPFEITLEHGKAEIVLPQGFAVQMPGPDGDALIKAGFTMPEPDGGAPAKIEAIEGAPADKARTKVTLHLVALPKEPGPHDMTVPSIPITIARSNGELLTICTEAHVISVEDPTSNTPDAMPKPNPPARRQVEVWELAQRLTETFVVAIVAGVCGAVLYTLWRRRPRPVPPPPPPRPPWEVALEELAALRHTTMLEDGHTAEYVDKVSDIIRRYLGDRFGFDGLEATSHEIRKELQKIIPPLLILSEVDRLLEESDLVKFARLVPPPDSCRVMRDRAESIVHATIPPPSPTDGSADPRMAPRSEVRS